MIHKYEQWLKESELAGANPPPASAPAPAGDGTTDMSNPATVAPEATPAPDATADTTGSTEATSALSEIDQFRELDNARKDAIKAFKKKQEEFLQIPDDVRKNPTEEADKTKIEGLKTELKDLNKAMKDAQSKWDDFNEQTLGIGEDDINDEP